MGIAALAILAFALHPAPATAAPPAGFQKILIVGAGLSSPTGFGIAPDGRIFILEQGGTVRIYKNGGLLATPFVVLPASGAGGDLGLLGIAFDPDFATNHFVYFHYVSDAGHSRIVRFSANSDTVSGSGTLIYEADTEEQEYHAGGAIAFGPDGKIYLALGDNDHSTQSQDLSTVTGKMLRLNKDGSIPSDNPFVGQSGKKPEIWASGFRNPFRFQFDSGSGRLYLGDVGNHNFEEINLITRGANYGWPVCEGSCGTSGMTNPVYTYPQSGQGSAVTGGFVYRNGNFPSQYQGSYFFGDYARGTLRTLSLNGSGGVTGNADFDMSAGTVVDLKQAPDGSFYYLTIFPGQLYRVAYTAGNQVPIAQAAADATTGPVPLTVHFTSAGSTDPEGQPLSYEWDFGDGTSSTGANPSHTYTQAGSYAVSLRVSDGTQSALAAPLTIAAGTPPTLTLTSPTDGSAYRAGDTIQYGATATDSTGAPLPESAYSTTITFHHDTHTHPFLGPLTGSHEGSFVIPKTGEHAADVWYEIQMTVTDASGLSATKSVEIFPVLRVITLATAPANQNLILNGQPITTPETFESVVGMEHLFGVPAMQLVGSTYYQFDTWSDGGAEQHTFATPETDAIVTASLKPTPPFSVQYYNNTNLTGSPVLTRNEGPIDHDFGTGAPAAGVNSDNFSIRYAKQHWFGGGRYRFETRSDDGIRLWIDGTALIDRWIKQGATTYTAETTLTPGNHDIRLEYYESGGGASVKLDWAPVTASTPPPPAGQSITAFSLINADTDQVINGYADMGSDVTLDLSALPTRNLNIRATTSPATVGSVRFGYDGNANYRTETNAPYALGSDEGGNYLAWTPTVGTHTVTATPFDGANGGGTAGTGKTLTLSVTDGGIPPPPSGPTVTALSLINADTDQVISGYDALSNGAILNLNTLPTRNLNIRATTTPSTVGSVRFGYDGNANYGLENNAPYALASDNGGDYLPWTPTVGDHTVTATPYSGGSGGGTSGTAKTVSFSVVDQ